MAVRTVHVDEGRVTLVDGDSLNYTLQSDGITHAEFVCKHRPNIVGFDGPGPHEWTLTTEKLDAPEGKPDDYAVNLKFPQCTGYRLRVAKEPDSHVVQDVEFAREGPNDFDFLPLIVKRVAKTQEREDHDKNQVTARLRGNADIFLRCCCLCPRSLQANSAQ